MNYLSVFYPYIPLCSVAMSDDLGQAVGAILGISIGGWILLEMGAELNSSGPIDFTALGTVFILVGVLATVLLVYALIASVK